MGLACTVSEQTIKNLQVKIIIFEKSAVYVHVFQNPVRRSRVGLSAILLIIKKNSQTKLEDLTLFQTSTVSTFYLLVLTLICCIGDKVISQF